MKKSISADKNQQLLEIKAFDALVSHLNLRWKLHKDLFQGAGKHSLFNESGSNVWREIENSIIDSVFMDISRLFDRAEMSGRANVSISRLLDSIDSSKYLEILGQNGENSLKLFEELIKPWRNRKLGHNDARIIIGADFLPDVEYSKIDELIFMVNEIARYVSLCTNDVDRHFPPSITGSAWTNRLFRVLREGVEALPPSMRRK